MKLSSKLFSLRELLAFHFNRKSPNSQTFGDLSQVANILDFQGLKNGRSFSPNFKRPSKTARTLLYYLRKPKY